MKVWLAQNLYPESMEALVARTKDDLVHAIRKQIDDSDFYEAMGRYPDDESDMDLIEEFFGEAYAKDGTTYIGEEWAINEVEVIGS